MEKKTLRKRVKSAVSALPTAEAARQSAIVREQLLRLIEQRQAGVVALFSPLADEVQIGSLAAELSCRVVMPRVSDDLVNMEFFDFSPEQMSEGAFGISEPQSEDCCSPEEIDLMVVPALAYTRDGVRLGRGRGFYDRYLAREGFRAYTVGVCYSCQIFDSLPSQMHDKRVNEVVWCGK